MAVPIEERVIAIASATQTLRTAGLVRRWVRLLSRPLRFLLKLNVGRVPLQRVRSHPERQSAWPRRALPSGMCTTNSLRYRVCLFRLHEIIRLRLENEFRITELAHLWEIEAGDFRLDRHAVTYEEFNCQVKKEAEGEDETDECADPDQLSYQLAGVPVEETSHGTRNTVPAAAVIARAIGEKAHRKHTPETVGAVNGNRSHGIVDLEDVLKKHAAENNEHSGD